jgi:hypothetical protein
MSIIIAGRFPNITPAEEAMSELRASGIPSQDICHFHNGPPGMHGTHQLGGDEDADPTARDAQDNTATVAAIGGVGGGIVGATVAGPIGAVAGAGVGAYTGALIGALTGAENHPRDGLLRRQAGLMSPYAPTSSIATKTSSAPCAATARWILKKPPACGATAIGSISIRLPPPVWWTNAQKGERYEQASRTDEHRGASLPRRLRKLLSTPDRTTCVCQCCRGRGAQRGRA